MSPHSDDLDGSDLFQDLIDETVLDIDSTQIGSGKVTDQLFKGWRGLKRILGQDFKEFFGSLPQACRDNFFLRPSGLV